MDLLNLSQENERRACDRTNFLRQIIIKLTDGTQIKGLTNDVSLGGVSLDVNNIPSQIKTGLTAELHIVLENGNKSSAFKCNIVRVSKKSIGIKLDKKSAPKFGIMLTKNLYKRKNNKGGLCV